jgi:hypothetical protein
MFAAHPMVDHGVFCTFVKEFKRDWLFTGSIHCARVFNGDFYANKKLRDVCGSNLLVIHRHDGTKPPNGSGGTICGNSSQCVKDFFLDDGGRTE